MRRLPAPGVALLAAVLIWLAACESVKPTPETDLLRTTEIYNTYLAKQEFDKAAIFVAAPLRAEYEARSRRITGLKILEHRLLAANHNESKGEAELMVEFEYYFRSSPRTTQYIDRQKWLLLLENGRPVWRLTSPFPSFQ